MAWRHCRARGGNRLGEGRGRWVCPCIRHAGRQRGRGGCCCCDRRGRGGSGGRQLRHTVAGGTRCLLRLLCALQALHGTAQPCRLLLEL